MRNFQIDGFGIWNCDLPITYEYYPVDSKFLNIDGTEIQLYSASLIMKDVKSLFTISSNQLKIPQHNECMLLAIVDGRFAYVTYDEIKEQNINAETKKQKFAFHIVAKENNNYSFISSIVQQ